MRPKLTLILLILNVALFGVIYLLEKRAASAEVFSQRYGLVFGPEASDLDTLAIQGPGLNEAWTLNKTGEGWVLTEPVQWPANPFAVNRLLNEIQFLEKETSFSLREVEETGQTLADYGLADPRLTLVIGRRGEEQRLHLGSPTEIGRRLYALSPEANQILVVSRDLLESLTIGIEELLSRNAFSLPAFEVQALSVQPTGAASPRLRLVRENGGWRFEAPVRAPADGKLVESRLANLTRLPVLDFVETPNSVQGLETPNVRITLDGSGQRQTLLLGNTTTMPDGEEAYFARRESSHYRFLVPAASLRFLDTASQEMRDRNFVSVAPGTADRIEISDGTRRLVLQQLENGDWQVLPEADGEDWIAEPAEETVMETLLLLIEELRAVEFVSDAPTTADLASWGLSTPSRIIRLTAGGRTYELHFGDRNFQDHLVYVKEKDEPFVYGVRPEILGYLRLDGLFFRDHLLEDLAETATIESFSITSVNSGETLAYYPPEENLPATTQRAYRSVADFIRQPRVRSYLEDDFAPEYRSGSMVLPWMYRLTAVLRLPGGQDNQTREVRYVFTDRLGGSTQLGGSPTHDVIFELPQSLIDSLYVLTEDLAMAEPRASVYEEEGELEQQEPPMGLPSLPSPAPESTTEGTDAP